MDWNQFEEENEAVEWELNEPLNQEINIGEFASLCIRGLPVCEDNCISRQIVGQNRCKCIRQRFSCPSHYQLYEKGRKKALQLMTAKGLGELVK